MLSIFVNQQLKKSITVESNEFVHKERIDVLLSTNLGDSIEIKAVEEKTGERLLLNDRNSLRFTQIEDFYISTVLSTQGIHLLFSKLAVK